MKSNNVTRWMWLMVMVLIGVGYQPAVQAEEVVVMGDSMMRTVARTLRRELRQHDVDVGIEVSIGSGLARLDVVDWHAQGVAAMARYQPRLVFVMMGANDNQAMRTGAGVLEFGMQAWNMEYGRRAGKLMDILLEGGARQVIWVGLPCMRDENLSQDVAAMGRLIAQQAEAREGVVYFPTIEIFCPDGDGYKSYITQENGMPLDVRSSDGIHLSRKGAEHLSQILVQTFLAQDTSDASPETNGK